MFFLKRASLTTIVIMLFCTCLSFAGEKTPSSPCRTIKIPLFQGRITADNINIRADSTTGSQIICSINKDEYVDVIAELYGWYKIRLPINAPAFIHKQFVELIDERSAKVISDNVNIRLHPTTKSAIIGKADKNEMVFIAGDRGEWYRIYPTLSTYGWINKSFVIKAARPKNIIIEKAKPPIMPSVSAATSAASSQKKQEENLIVMEGILKPKIITKVATHKLVAENKKIFLLNSSKVNLSPYNNSRVKITGKFVEPAKNTNPLIEVEKIEALD